MRAIGLMALACLAVAAVNPQLGQVHSVYVLQMGNGMDQFLANRMARLGWQVTTDPQAADAILTDKIGQGFEKRLEELYPPPTPPPAPKEEGKGPETMTLKGDTEQTRVPSFGRGRGNFFLVDRKSRMVIWSVYEPPKNSSTRELNRTAEKVVERLKKDMQPAGN